MTASDHLSRGQFFHGTNAELNPGDHVVQTGRGYEPDSGKYNFFTDDRGHASYYAKSKARTWGGSPHVYSVEPTGEHEPDTYDQTGWGNASRSVHPLRVIGEV